MMKDGHLNYEPLDAEVVEPKRAGVLLTRRRKIAAAATATLFVIGMTAAAYAPPRCWRKKPMDDGNCKVLFDGCNQCTRAVVGGEFACTRMFCEEYERPECLEFFDFQRPPQIMDEQSADVEPERMETDENCKTFFDGCNNCVRSAVGEVYACTEMYCENPAKPKCLERFNDKDGFAPSGMMVNPEYADEMRGAGNSGEPGQGVVLGRHQPFRPHGMMARPDVVHSTDAEAPTEHAFHRPHGHHGGMFGRPGKMMAHPDVVEKYRAGDATPFTEPSEPFVPHMRAKELTSTPKEDCLVWFDGCNVCRRSTTAGDFACTRKLCPFMMKSGAGCMKP